MHIDLYLTITLAVHKCIVFAASSGAHMPNIIVQSLAECVTFTLSLFDNDMRGLREYNFATYTVSLKIHFPIYVHYAFSKLPYILFVNSLSEA